MRTSGCGGQAPKIVVVEPQRAACLFESARAGRPVTIPHGEPTVMAMLECATPSPLGFEILAALADGFVTLEEHEATDAMKRLADPLGGDAAVVAGESGGTGLAGLLACRGDPGGACASRPRAGIAHTPLQQRRRDRFGDLSPDRRPHAATGDRSLR